MPNYVDFLTKKEKVSNRETKKIFKTEMIVVVVHLKKLNA
jgi:hypothetical protein